MMPSKSPDLMVFVSMDDSDIDKTDLFYLLTQCNAMQHKVAN